MRERTAEGTWGRRDQGTEGPRVAEISGQCPRYVPSSGNDAISAEYVWDGENRLPGVMAMAPRAGDKCCESTYDYPVRRIEKKVYDWHGQAWETIRSPVRRFVGSGWLSEAERRLGRRLRPLPVGRPRRNRRADEKASNGRESPQLSRFLIRFSRARRCSVEVLKVRCARMCRLLLLWPSPMFIAQALGLAGVIWFISEIVLGTLLKVPATIPSQAAARAAGALALIVAVGWGLLSGRALRRGRVRRRTVTLGEPHTVFADEVELAPLEGLQVWVSSRSHGMAGASLDVELRAHVENEDCDAVWSERRVLMAQPWWYRRGLWPNPSATVFRPSAWAGTRFRLRVSYTDPYGRSGEFRIRYVRAVALDRLLDRVGIR